MGCYDTVHFTCPKCNEKVEVQSKGGKCNLRDYKSSRVPADVGGYIEDREVECESCKAKLIVKAPRISLSLVEVDSEDDFD